MKKIALAVISAAIIVAGYCGYQQHAETAFAEALMPHIKNASIRVTNSSEIEIKPSQATFKELFDRLDSDVTEIDKHLIEVQSISSSKTEKISSPAIAYLRATQEFSRSLSMKYRKTLAVSNALDRYKESLNDRFSSSSYGYEYARQRSNKASEDFDSALEESKSAAKDFIMATASLKEARSKAAPFFADDALIPMKQLDALTAASDRKEKGKSEAKK